MTYPKTLSAGLRRRLRPLMRRLNDLTEGDSLTLEGPHEYLRRVRYNFLVWARFDHREWGTRLREGCLCITLKRMVAPAEADLPNPQAECAVPLEAFDAEDFVIEELLDAETESEVHTVCVSHALTPAQTEAALTAWLRINA